MFSRCHTTTDKFHFFLAITFLCFSFLFTQTGCSDAPQSSNKKNTQLSAITKQPPAEKKKVLLVNSYHQEYFWTAGITKAVLKKFGANFDPQGRIDNSKSKVTLNIINMDTKRNPSEDEVVQAIHKINPTAKVIVSSGYSNDPVMANYRDYGFCAAIVKPFQLQDLMKVLSRVLETRLHHS